MEPEWVYWFILFCALTPRLALRFLEEKEGGTGAAWQAVEELPRRRVEARGLHLSLGIP